ncbi:SGNH/GDSL hydrolase family protein [Modestobacter versicolor]|uniref:Lysophospholipase L1-like esterase n=1 Tax=Modestobacter versicolor TaxID=429133 RepID=A0A323VEC0_9ACTN|nr:SGNH/GDSL hydrolase family protein [Modestobacter versicolor]MBB3677004.1 lysophospholipase L1-like esterase [Modestobacter versicolor]PZA22951.1 hypothetical protein DMO24_02355 [Modestobacter versicolor]
MSGRLSHPLVWAAAVVAGLVLVVVLVVTSSGGPGSSGGASAGETPASLTAADPPLTRPAGRPLRVLFAGDSITDGAFAIEPGTGAFPALITERLEQDGPVDSTIIGGPGLTAAQVMPEVPGAGPADVVVVEVGTNDELRSTAAQFAVDFPAFLNAVRAQSPSAVLVCLGDWNDTAITAQLDAIMAQECAERDGSFTALSALYRDLSLHGPAGVTRSDGWVTDEFHPNDAGHAAIAEKVLDELGVTSAG